MSDTQRVFLSAEWLHLAMLNYSVDPTLLLPHVPAGTTPDSFDGKTYVSLVGFIFRRTKMFGRVSVPFHSEFEEVNLRFYVYRNYGTERRRGVVFIKEIVPRPAIALTARLIYGENYVSLPMAHKIAPAADRIEVEYSWKSLGRWLRLTASANGVPQLPAENSLEQYITEHYWGYSKNRKGRTLEYQVTHAQWRLWSSCTAQFVGNDEELYGREFGTVLAQRPDSAFIAEGSPVQVLRGREIS